MMFMVIYKIVEKSGRVYFFQSAMCATAQDVIARLTICGYNANEIDEVYDTNVSQVYPMK